MSTTTQPKKSTVKKTTSTTTVEQSTTNGSTTPEQPKRPSVASLQKKVDELSALLKPLEKFPQVSSQVASIAAQLQRHEDELKGVDEHEDNPYLVIAHERKINTMDAGLQGLAREIARLDDISARQDVTDGNVATLKDKQNGLVGRVRSIEIVTRSYKFPTWSVLVALVLGIVAGVLWHLYPFVSPVAGLTGEETQYIPDFRNELLYAILFGAAVFFGIMTIALLASFAKHASDVRKDQAQQSSAITQDPEYTTLQSYTPAIPQNPNPVTDQQPAEVAPTRPFAAQGAPTSAR